MNDSLTAEEIAAKEATQAYGAAIRLLASRDHSVVELTRKLKQREHGSVAIDAALVELIEANYVNDARYAELYAEQRMNHGYGPLSIRSKLATRGLDSHHVRRAMQLLDVDWVEQAEKVIYKRFTSHEITDTDQAATARIARFLQGRGFNSSDVLRGLNQARRELGRTPSG
ncbi:regulatory protein RecX [Granulosicoccus antarcticus]|uniref:Regulatory protein RecX n=1 Tax=Granulosicoccus antarcticus IMCC3135 TaxID=1192854 RepID=A0A2Z2NMM4_9GAMM|nr:regulatory protein RecX [Granulosicoccus antarcticus]ASJ72469.1 Regulatory protein RecX [Granulosicoccus antarcticus IMCC3135]